MEGINKLDKPNSPDSQSYTTPLNGRVSAAFNTEQLGRVLSQLVTGYRTLENALLSRQTGLELCGNRETLNRVFTLRPQHVTEYF